METLEEMPCTDTLTRPSVLESVTRTIGTDSFTIDLLKDQELSHPFGYQFSATFQGRAYSGSGSGHRDTYGAFWGANMKLEGVFRKLGWTHDHPVFTDLVRLTSPSFRDAGNFTFNRHGVCTNYETVEFATAREKVTVRFAQLKSGLWGGAITVDTENGNTGYSEPLAHTMIHTRFTHATKQAAINEQLQRAIQRVAGCEAMTERLKAYIGQKQQLSLF